MNKRILELKEKALKFYEDHKEYVNYVIIGIACLFLGGMKGKADAIDQLSDMTFTFKVNEDVRKRVSSQSD